MISLVIDTAVSNLFVGIVKDDVILSQYNQKVEKDLSSIIFEVLDNVINKAKIDKRSINNIFVSVGPGSFTGVRIGVTIAKVYAWSLGIKVIPFSSLEFMCSGYNEDCISLIDARRGYVYSGKYSSDLKNLKEDKYTLLADVEEDNVKYISFENFDGLTVYEPKYDMLKIVQKHINDDGVNPHNLNPRYLKITEAEEKLQNND